MDINASHGISHRVRGFYAELYGWSDRPRTVSLVLQLRHELHRYHALKDVLPDPTIHERIVACVRERDADGAARIMREHLRSSRDALVAVLRREARERGHGRRQRPDPRP
jgi:DNA-binding GntR family transcriptional regulator